jgi:hypothetical protein
MYILLMKNIIILLTNYVKRKRVDIEGKGISPIISYFSGLTKDGKRLVFIKKICSINFLIIVLVRKLC